MYHRRKIEIVEKFTHHSRHIFRNVLLVSRLGQHRNKLLSQLFCPFKSCLPAPVLNALADLLAVLISYSLYLRILLLAHLSKFPAELALQSLGISLAIQIHYIPKKLGALHSKQSLVKGTNRFLKLCNILVELLHLCLGSLGTLTLGKHKLLELFTLFSQLSSFLLHGLLLVLVPLEKLLVRLRSRNTLKRICNDISRSLITTVTGGIFYFVFFLIGLDFFAKL